MLFEKNNGSRADVVKFRSRLNHGNPNIHPTKTDPPAWDDEAGVNMVRAVYDLSYFKFFKPSSSVLTCYFVAVL
jgi:hypothetical protein